MKTKTRNILTMCCLVTLILSIDGLATEKPADAGLRFSDGHEALNIPFEDDNNLIFVKVRINNFNPVWFILDTGAPINVLDTNFANQLKLELLSKNKKSFDNGLEYIQVNGLNLSLPGVDIMGQPAGVMPLQDIPPVAGKECAGILGYDFISKVILKIDYEGKTISIFDPDHFEYSGDGEHLSLSMKEKWPLIPVTLYQNNSSPINGEIILDTGSLMSLALMNADLARETIDFPLSFGVEGVGQGCLIGRIQSIGMGEYKITNPVAGFPTAVDTQSVMSEVKQAGLGIIGSEILRRFTLIFDYSRLSLIAEANRNFNQSYEWDMSGMFLIAMGTSFKTFTVFKITSGSPAELAGIKEGDVIVAVDDQPSEEFTLSQLRSLFKNNGKKVQLKIQRGETILDISIKLKRMI